MFFKKKINKGPVQSVKNRDMRNVFSKKTSRFSTTGMTFIEIIVVIGIFAAIAATVLFNYRDFSTSVEMQNLAQEIALQIKKAQSDAISGKSPRVNTGIQDPPLPGWIPSYGVAFDITNDEDPTQFAFYFNRYNPETDTEDETRNLEYLDYMDTGSEQYCGDDDTSECLDEIQITDGHYISALCVNVSGGDSCDDGTFVSELHISFTRPFPNAYIVDDESFYTQKRSDALIELTSRDGEIRRSIYVNETGRISIK